MSGSIKSKENFWLLSFWRLMSRVNNVEENIISGEIKPRRIKSQGNSCPGGKFWRKTYREEKVWGKDGAKPQLKYMITRCGHVVRDFESGAKTRCNFQF